MREGSCHVTSLCNIPHSLFNIDKLSNIDNLVLPILPIPLLFAKPSSHAEVESSRLKVFAYLTSISPETGPARAPIYTVGTVPNGGL